MKHTKIRELLASVGQHEGKPVSVCGWVRTVRDSKSFGFMEINDGSCFKNMQVVFEAGKIAGYEAVAKTNVGASVMVRGTVVATPGAKQPAELHADSIIIEGESAPDYPMQKKRHSMEYLRTVAHLRPRTNTFSAAYRVRSETSFAIHNFFHRRGFVYVHTPIITCSDCEGAGAMFQVTTLDMKNPPLCQDGRIDYSRDFFGKKAGLTVSGQLNGEAMAHAFGNIYTFGPTFRAENSNTPRHAAEFWMIEPEMYFADLSDDMDVCEDMIKSVLGHLFEHCADELEFFNSFVDKELMARLQAVYSADFERITYTEAVSLLEKAKDNFEFAPYWGCDLQTEHERYLAETVMKKPVFVTDYPKDIKAFYMRGNDDGKTVAAMDLLVAGVGEIVGGSQREERLDILTTRMREHGLNTEDYSWYLDLRRWGAAKHAGFGLGFERFIMYVTGIANIRDALPFPRVTGSAEF
ncbi:MAG: asparagine--tRNA ligase [Clostridia bacterium]|nr:asparagine--tRNA ligase [Clostridia bacterium]